MNQQRKFIIEKNTLIEKYEKEKIEIREQIMREVRTHSHSESIQIIDKSDVTKAEYENKIKTLENKIRLLEEQLRK